MKFLKGFLAFISVLHCTCNQETIQQSVHSYRSTVVARSTEFNYQYRYYSSVLEYYSTTVNEDGTTPNAKSQYWTFSTRYSSTVVLRAHVSGKPKKALVCILEGRQCMELHGSFQVCTRKVLECCTHNP